MLVPWDRVILKLVGYPSEVKQVYLDHAEREEKDAWEELLILYRSEPVEKLSIADRISNFIYATDIRIETRSQWCDRVSEAERAYHLAMKDLVEARAKFAPRGLRRPSH